LQLLLINPKKQRTRDIVISRKTGLGKNYRNTRLGVLTATLKSRGKGKQKKRGLIGGGGAGQ